MAIVGAMRSEEGGVVLEWLVQVVATGGSAFVGAAGTEAWQVARNGVVRLFRLGGQRGKMPPGGGQTRLRQRSKKRRRPSGRSCGNGWR